jgi:hypothetical protein
MRERGQICCSCKVPLQPPPASERYCNRCVPGRRIYMHYQQMRAGWRVSFLEKDLKTALPRTFLFQDQQKVIEMAKRGGADFTLAGRQVIEQGLRNGRGGVWLNLCEEQWKRLG